MWRVDVNCGVQNIVPQCEVVFVNTCQDSQELSELPENCRPKDPLILISAGFGILAVYTGQRGKQLCFCVLRTLEVLSLCGLAALAVPQPFQDFHQF